MRLNKAIALTGVASRRRAEQLIQAGRVTVNGRVITDPAYDVDLRLDRILVDGRALTPARQRVAIMLNKPKGYVTTLRDPHAQKRVVDLLHGAPAGLHPVGRLDADSRGLLLFTNDGELTSVLTHPRFQVEKTYRVRVKGRPAPSLLRDLERGIELADGPTAPVKIVAQRVEGDTTVLELVIREGRYRQIRRMFATIGHPVLDLQRIAFGPIRLDGLPEGRWRWLRKSELQALHQLKHSRRSSV